MEYLNLNTRAIAKIVVMLFSALRSRQPRVALSIAGGKPRRAQKLAANYPKVASMVSGSSRVRLLARICHPHVIRVPFPYGVAPKRVVSQARIHRR